MLLSILLAVSVSVREHVTAKEVTYTYHVTNRTHQRIVAVRIGYDAEHDNPELATLPPRWTFAKGLARGTAYVPAGWTVRLVTTEENPKFMLDCSSDKGSPSLTFRISLRTRAAEYRRAHYEIRFADGTRVRGTVRPVT